MILDPDLSSIRPLSSRPFTNVWASEDEERYTSSMVDNFTLNSTDGPGRQCPDGCRKGSRGHGITNIVILQVDTEIPFVAVYISSIDRAPRNAYENAQVDPQVKFKRLCQSFLEISTLTFELGLEG